MAREEDMYEAKRVQIDKDTTLKYFLDLITKEEVVARLLELMNILRTYPENGKSVKNFFQFK